MKITIELLSGFIIAGSGPTEAEAVAALNASANRSRCRDDVTAPPEPFADLAAAETWVLDAPLPEGATEDDEPGPFITIQYD